ncbi:hypothetical protein N5D03_05245 [Empedobacter sp. GD03861]|uniref:tetratricopeptide repeat protein n=1 Tax=Empedobacter sp. GD03861 TaxID=2975390 RepID=UPI002447B555|nr:tetratricopeptide repeat protein [Empedobacter sp. GD03861]MDH0673936.1 hypothetical protein [Empedobacter sp. GD03861]
MTRIEYLVAHPYEVEKSDIPLLKKEVEKYPYFYTLRALLLYGLKKENHPSFEDYLNKTSIHSSNRVDLYHYMNSEKIEQEIISEDNETDIVTSIVDEKITPSNVVLSENENITDPFIEIENETIENEHQINEVKLDIESNISENETNNDDETKNNGLSEIDIEHAIQQTTEIEVKEFIIEEAEVNYEEKTSSQKEIIEINSDSTFSFSDWLKKFPSQQKDQKTIEEEQEIAEREIKYKLIDDFLEKNPKIVPMKKSEITPVNSASNFVQNSEEYSDLMTETLAQIYIEQKKYDKAIKAYKILILKYPEKNGLFANRIKEIENLKNSK